MIVSKSLSRALLAASLCVSVASVVGCPKKDPDKATKDDDEKSGKAKSSDGYVRGEVLKHVPSKCGVARLYMDLAAIRKLDGVGSNLDSLQENLIDGATSNDGKKMKKALKALDKAGIDPKKALQELAICVHDDKNVTVAIGGSVKGKDALDAVGKGAEALGADKIEKKKKKGLSYLRIEETAMGMVSDTVLVVTMDDDALADLVDENDVSADWDVDGKLVSGFFARKKGGEKDLDVSGSIESSGDELVLSMTGKAKGAEAKKKLEDDAPKVKKELKSMLEYFAAAVEKVPAKGLAEDIGDTKVTVEDGVITGKMTVKSKNLAKALDKVAKMDESQLQALFK